MVTIALCFTANHAIRLGEPWRGREMCFLGKNMEDENCKCSDCILRILLVILLLLGILVLVFFVCQMMKEILVPKPSSPDYFNTLLSGIIGSGISAGLVYAGLREGNKSKQIENQIKLRELFSEKQRWEVYRTIQSGVKPYFSPTRYDTSYWHQLENKNLQNCQKNEYIQTFDEFSKTTAYKYYFFPALCDYIGLFEVAYMMIKEGQLSKKNFEVSYKYRIGNLLQIKVVREMIFGYEKNYWKTFRKLVEEFSY